MIAQKEPRNLEYFSYLGGMIKNDARRTRGIKSRNFAAKASLNKKKKVGFQFNL